MLLHSIKYSFKCLLRSKESIFWTLVFPIALATFMYAAFGNIFNEDEIFSTIPVTVIYEQDNETNEAFKEAMTSLSDDGGEKLFEIKDLSEKDAKEALVDKDISGIIYVDDELSLKVAESGYDQTVLKIFLEQFTQYSDTIYNIGKDNPEALKKVLEKMNDDVCYYTEVTTSDGNQDSMVTYFYAIFAMSCLFASFSSVERTVKLQASASALGQRRAVAPTKKFIVVLSEFITIEILHFIIECITLLYMVFVLGIDFGDKYGFILLLLFTGSSFGVALGMLIGSLRKLSSGMKDGITVGISMLLSIMADLCVGGIRNTIEHNCPIINRINPAALIVDSFYALNVYDTYERFIRNIVSLAVITVIVCVVNVFMLRNDE